MNAQTLLYAAAAAYFLSDGIAKVGLLSGKAGEATRTVAGIIQVICAGAALFVVLKGLI